MTDSKNDNRTKLIRAAGKKSFDQGFGNTSLADIARESGIPLGNVYYYFKTKEALGEAVIEERFAEVCAAHQEWEEGGAPKERLCAFVDSVLANRDVLAQGGCPIGTLCSELNKERGPLAVKASRLLREHLAWSQRQFELLGRKEEAHSLAVHLLSGLQGVGVLAHSLMDPDIVGVETERLRKWIESL